MAEPGSWNVAQVCHVSFTYELWLFVPEL
jgi:hypothetical protein